MKESAAEEYKAARREGVMQWSGKEEEFGERVAELLRGGPNAERVPGPAPTGEREWRTGEDEVMTQFEGWLWKLHEVEVVRIAVSGWLPEILPLARDLINQRVGWSIRDTLGFRSPGCRVSNAVRLAVERWMEEMPDDVFKRAATPGNILMSALLWARDEAVRQLAQERAARASAAAEQAEHAASEGQPPAPKANPKLRVKFTPGPRPAEPKANPKLRVKFVRTATGEAQPPEPTPKPGVQENPKVRVRFTHRPQPAADGPDPRKPR
jgi:hypothetical protein